jgi:hypothetical protein
VSEEKAIAVLISPTKSRLFMLSTLGRDCPF